MIATVLLISFVVILSGVIMFWGRQFVTELMEKRGEVAVAKLDCESVDMEIIGIEGSNIRIRNNSPFRLNGFILRFVDSGMSTEDNTVLGSYEDGLIDISSFTGDVDIIPMLRPEGIGAPPIPCSNKHKLINRKEV